MPAAKADLITHPIRARVLSTLMGRQLTTHQIAQLLPDVPLPSLYRHIRTLSDAGVLIAADEVRVNGALTKVYAVAKGQTRIAPEDVADASKADHLRYFTTFLNTLAETFRGYLEQEPEAASDVPVQCLMETLHLSPSEHKAFCAALHEFLQPWRSKTPGEDRRRLIFAHILHPDRPDPPLT